MKKLYIIPTTEQQEMLGGYCMNTGSGLVDNNPTDGMQDPAPARNNGRVRVF